MTKKNELVKDDNKLMFGFKPKTAKEDVKKTETKKTEPKKKVKRK